MVTADSLLENLLQRQAAQTHLAVGTAEYYFLDWCPMGFIPPDGEKIRRPEIDVQQLKAHLTHPDAELKFANVEQIQATQVLVRGDGLFLVRLVLQEPFDKEGVDELAHVTGLFVKSALGHGHHFHRLYEPLETGRAARIRFIIVILLFCMILGVEMVPVLVVLSWFGVRWLIRKMRAFGPKKLRASRVLTVYPVRVRLDMPLDRTTFHNAALKKLRVHPDTKRQDDPDEALLCLKIAYQRLFDDVANRLVEHARSRHKPRPILRGFAFLMYVIPSAIIVIFALVGLDWLIPVFKAEAFFQPRFLQSAPLVTVGVILSADFFFKMRTWDLPKVKLLRAAFGFFAHANPLNAVVRAVFPAERHGEDFSDAIRTLQIKAEGEAHRLTMSQFWLSLCTGATGLLLAALALRP